MAQQKEILIVDDEVGIRELLSEILQDEGYRVSLAENAGEARTYRARTQPSLVLLDIWMPDTDGVTLLREWAANGQLTMPVVMMSGHGTIETAVEATKIGAFDFLEKPVGLQKLLSTITRALKTAAGQGPRRISLAALGTSAPVIEVERAIEQLLRANRPLLIVGEPGAGHEIVARALHLPETPFVEHADRRAPGDQSAAGARGGARRNAVLRRNRRVFEGGAERARVPAWPSSNGTAPCSSAPAASSSATSLPKGASIPRCWRVLSAGAVMLPPLRQRREDIPALVDRFWREITASQRTVATLHASAVVALSRRTGRATWSTCTTSSPISR